jgi:hypothetical protein
MKEINQFTLDPDVPNESQPKTGKASEKHNKPFVFNVGSTSPQSTNSRLKFMTKAISIEKENIPFVNLKNNQSPTDRFGKINAGCRFVSPVRTLNFGGCSIKKFNPKITRSTSRKEKEEEDCKIFKARPAPSFQIPFVIYNSTKLTKFKEFELVTSRNRRIDKKLAYEHQKMQRQVETTRNQSPTDKIKLVMKDKVRQKGMFSNLLGRIV